MRIPGPCAHLDFLIIGAMKAGSTSLFEFLAAHPSVYVPRSKEPHYFSMRYHYPSAYYRWLFRARGEHQICGEASTSYSNIRLFPRCPERIANDAPNVRIIYVVRDPIERIMSNLRHLQLRGQEVTIDSKAVKDPSLWSKSRYRDTIEAYLEFLPRSRIFVADLKDLRKGDQCLRQILQFLDLDPHVYDSLTLPKSNVSKRRRVKPQWVSRLALSPIGALLRDMLPSDKIQQLKSLVAKPKQADDIELEGINADVLRENFPELCDQLDSQYQWVQKHFINLPDNQIAEQHQPADSEMTDAVPMQTRLTAAHTEPLLSEPMPPKEADEPAIQSIEAWQSPTGGEFADRTESQLEDPTMPFVTEELRTERMELGEAVISNTTAYPAEPREAAEASQSASSPRLGRWIMLSMIALIGSFYLLTDEDVMNGLQPELDLAHRFEEFRESWATTLQLGSVAAPEESAANAPEIAVTFRFLGECWAEVSDARRRRIYDLMKPGTESSFDAVLPLQVILGKPSAVEIKVGGEDFQVPASARTRAGTARFTIDVNDIR